MGNKTQCKLYKDINLYILQAVFQQFVNIVISCLFRFWQIFVYLMITIFQMHLSKSFLTSFVKLICINFKILLYLHCRTQHGSNIKVLIFCTITIIHPYRHILLIFLTLKTLQNFLIAIHVHKLINSICKKPIVNGTMHILVHAPISLWAWISGTLT